MIQYYQIEQTHVAPYTECKIQSCNSNQLNIMEKLDCQYPYKVPQTHNHVVSLYAHKSYLHDWRIKFWCFKNQIDTLFGLNEITQWGKETIVSKTFLGLLLGILLIACPKLPIYLCMCFVDVTLLVWIILANNLVMNNTLDLLIIKIRETLQFQCAKMQ
jgi:hypothetical protein